MPTAWMLKISQCPEVSFDWVVTFQNLDAIMSNGANYRFSFNNAILLISVYVRLFIAWSSSQLAQNKHLLNTFLSVAFIIIVLWCWLSSSSLEFSWIVQLQNCLQRIELRLYQFLVIHTLQCGDNEYGARLII